MASPGFWDSLMRDLTGRGMFGGSFQLRLVLQPLAAVVLGVRVGIRDAKHGELPFFQALLRKKGGRGGLLGKAVRDAVVPISIAFVVDSILQRLINHHIRPLESLFVGALLVFLPFLVARALTNRIWTRGHPGAHRAGSARQGAP
ncbi:MAG TPA: hypothetical protein VHL80_20635 [Polyangia bacterium]|nr:hypothetical protein [Polyangia bacterium]